MFLPPIYFMFFQRGLSICDKIKILQKNTSRSYKFHAKLPSIDAQKVLFCKEYKSRLHVAKCTLQNRFLAPTGETVRNIPHC